MPSTALYYPWMNIEDGEWLRLALLTWHGIVRIRPHELEDDDDEVIDQIKSESDFITEIFPSPEAIRTVNDIIADAITGREDELAARYSMATTTATQEGHDDQLVDIACPDASALTTPLPQTLLRLGLARPANQDDYGDEVPRLEVEHRFGMIYMACLADTVARRNLLTPATDDPAMFHAVGALDRVEEMLFGDGVSSIQNLDNAYLELSLRAAIQPKHLTSVPAVKLIQFRQRYSSELEALHDHVTGLATQLQQITLVENPKVAHIHLEELYRRETQPLLDSLRRSLRSMGIESTTSALALKVDLGPAAATILGGIAAAGGQLAIAGAAAALAILPYTADKLAARRRIIASSPVAYLLAVERKFGGNKAFQSLLAR